MPCMLFLLFYFFPILFDLCYFCANFAARERRLPDGRQNLAQTIEWNNCFFLSFMQKTNIAIFVSGSGSNCENLIRYFENSGSVNTALVLSNRADAYALVRAERLGVPSVVINKAGLNDPDVMKPILEQYAIDMIVLAGFLPMVPDYLIELFPQRIINIHPALLPKHGGKGMWGHHVHEAVKAAGDTETGITVHYVTPVCDGGEIIEQYSVALSPDDTVDEIAAKEHELEMRYFPEIVERVIKRMHSERNDNE